MAEEEHSSKHATHAAELWSFAVTLYARPGVGEACLALQDRGGANVPFLLFVLWLGAGRGVCLSAGDVVGLRAAVAPWHAEVVDQLRALRRRLKNGPPPAPSAATDALREKIKAAELSAERMELDTLAGLAEGFEPAAVPPSAAEANLALALGALVEQDWAAAAAGVLHDAVNAQAIR